jgi:NTP pyrophosphatase (non-canonical NTP hydrolase)
VQITDSKNKGFFVDYKLFICGILTIHQFMDFGQQMLFAEDKPLVHLNEYQNLAVQSDQNVRGGLHGLGMPVLGLFGEVGSLLSALKKKQRDKDSFTGYADTVIEELGDVLWYFSNIATRADLELSVIAQRAFRDLRDWDHVKTDAFGTFGDVQPKGNFSGPAAPHVFEKRVLDLASKTGLLVDDLRSGKIATNRDVLSGHLVDVFRSLIAAATAANVSLEEAAHSNLRKTFSRWPQKRKHVPLFDERFDVGEQLPRKIEMHFIEKKVGDKLYVIQQCRGINIGDRLTDNRVESDDYRFHDVFHLAYAAILGWSPVIRSLLKLKRKSDPIVDENQDGARAILIEEGIATWVFNHGQRLNFYKSLRSVDYELLKSIREFVKGYEVEKCPLWQWEEAVLAGFASFRKLRQYRSGVITADLNKHTLAFARLR